MMLAALPAHPGRRSETVLPAGRSGEVMITRDTLASEIHSCLHHRITGDDRRAELRQARRREYGTCHVREVRGECHCE